MYRVYFLNTYTGRQFPTRDQAREYIDDQSHPEDYEILDDSDF